MTLLEILIVMVILGLLATLGSVQLMGYLGKAKAQTAKLQMEELSTAIELFRIDTGRLPKQGEGLTALSQQPSDLESWNGPYLRKTAVINDPWGRPFLYRSPAAGAEFELRSLGADGKEGGEGVDTDIISTAR